MSLRKRVSLVAATTVAVAIVLVAFICYWVVRGQLTGQVDDLLRAQATAFQSGDFHALAQQVPGIPASAGGSAPYWEIVGPDGVPLARQGSVSLPVDSHAVDVATGRSNSYLGTIWVGNVHVREYMFPQAVQVNNQQFETVAIVLARPLNTVDDVLSNLRLILLLLAIGGVALAAVLGRMAARRVLSPLVEVTETAHYIGRTDDLSSRLVVHADDEVGQLAMRFNEMLERLEHSRHALDESVRAQRQLVADASHELRTPITSLRTNIEVLLASPHIDEEDRRRLLRDVVEQSEELTGLIGDLIELARGDLPAESTEDVRLDRIAEEAVARARRNSPGTQFEATLEPMIVEGNAERLSRAINNLLDNAARHSPPGGTVEVVVDGTGVQVRDHGPGIDEQDLPHVFDRFFRGANTRGQQGSGLGLAIVRQVTSQHGGTATAANAPGGGAVFTLHLPSTPAGAEQVTAPAPA